MYQSFDGIYASTIVPLRDDESMDLDALGQHLESVSAVEGIRGLLINGHAGENFTLSADDKRRVIEQARAAVGHGKLLISGVYAESTAQACVEARQAEAAGADALLVFPPFSWALCEMPDVIVAHHHEIIRQTSLPVMLYQASIGAGHLSYSQEALGELLQLDRIAGIKEGSWETSRYEANYRFVQEAAPGVRIMPSGDEHLLSTFMVGGHGSQVSIAAIVPELVVALWHAVARGDMADALAIHQKIYPLARAIYGSHPGARATARIKTCLHLLGRIPTTVMRSPMTSSDAQERSRLEKVLIESGILN